VAVIGPHEQLRLSIDTLTAKGLNLFAVLDYNSLPDTAQSCLTDFSFPMTASTRIVLMGHGGRALWEKLHIDGSTPNPIDQHSKAAALAFAKEVLGESEFHLIYPGDTPIALQQLGTIAGWHTPSPLGLGINPRWGLWYAYRAALLTNAELPVIVELPPERPCDRCLEKPCLSSCPAGALANDRQIGIDQCASYRLSDNSSCNDRCLARMSCPVSNEHRYTLEQIQYHYRLSLETLRHYYC
jgi:epoxyqueuosine reductase